MTLKLTLEHAPHRQSVTEMSHEGGDLIIGRGPDCDWQIDDPDMFVSRTHCVISGRDGVFTVTDSSRGGLFIDGGDKPLGQGNSTAIEDGMRLRLGDFVMRLALAGGRAATAAPKPAARTTAPGARRDLDHDDFFSTRPEPEPERPRPKNLPEPFESGRPSGFVGDEPKQREPDRPPLFDDPFTLDPVATPGRGAEPSPDTPRSVVRRPRAERREEPPRDPFGTGDTPARATDDGDGGFGFDFGGPAVDDSGPAADRSPAGTARGGDPFFGFGPELAPEPEPGPEPEARPEPAAEARRQAPPAPRSAASDAALREAFFRGLGIDLSESQDPVAEMEAMGRRFRTLTEGVVYLLRTRAREKVDVGAPQTVIGNQDVNPLKFLVTTEDAVESLVEPRGKGYLDPDRAIAGAFRDLADHHVRTWQGVQAALRKMIDRFEPKTIEAEMEAAGLIGALLAGGRGAKLWQLYKERYTQIARSAENRFLGEVGEDFRDAYEGKGRERP